MIRLLIAEDDLLFAQTLEDFLTEEGFDVTLCADGALAEQLCYENHYDLLLLDINMPSVNGLELLQSLRKEKNTTPAIYLTSYKDKETLLKGFEIGADDYLRKPVDLDELLMRISALLKRSHKSHITFQIGAFHYNKEKKILSTSDKEVTLSRKLSLLLDILTENPDEVVSKEIIKSRLWNWDEAPSNGALRVYINELKKILGREHILNIKGIGYKLAL